MEHHIVGPLVGVLIVGATCALLTVACFARALRLLLSPGESAPDHPKYRVLRNDR